jgi:hypothetical protein
MSFLSDTEARLGIIETDVVQFFSVTLPKIETAVEADITAAASWLVNKALPWMSAHGQEISTDVLGLVGVVASLGIGVPAPVMAAAAALNEGTTLVNAAIAAAQQAAAGNKSAVQQAVAAGTAAYQGLKTAQIATSQAQSSAVAPSATGVPVAATS